MEAHPHAPSRTLTPKPPPMKGEGANLAPPTLSLNIYIPATWIAEPVSVQSKGGHSLTPCLSPFMGDILPRNKAPSPMKGERHGVRVGMPAQLALDDCSTLTLNTYLSPPC